MPKVKEEKAKYIVKGKTLTELAKEVKPLIQKKKKLEGQVEELKSAIHAIMVGVVPKIMEDQEQDFVNIPGVGALELATEVYPYVSGENLETFYAWLEARGQRGIVKETIHPKTLQAFVKEQLEAGVDFKDSGCKIGLVPTASLKAEKKTKKR